MQNYKHLHMLESQCKYDENHSNIKNTLYADYIHKNFHKMDETEMRLLACKILSEKQVKQILLNYELVNYVNHKKRNMTLDDFIKYFNNTIDKFQWKSGGFHLEDRQWYVYTYGSQEHTLENLKENQVLFENSVDLLDANDLETQNYLENLTKYLSNASDNIELDFKCSNKFSKSILFVQIIATCKN